MSQRQILAPIFQFQSEEENRREVFIKLWSVLLQKAENCRWAEEASPHFPMSEEKLEE